MLLTGVNDECLKELLTVSDTNKGVDVDAADAGWKYSSYSGGNYWWMLYYPNTHTVRCQCESAQYAKDQTALMLAVANADIKFVLLN